MAERSGSATDLRTPPSNDGCRRYLLVAARSGERRLTRPTAAAQARRRAGAPLQRADDCIKNAECSEPVEGPLQRGRPLGHGLPPSSRATRVGVGFGSTARARRRLRERPVQIIRPTPAYRTGAGCSGWKADANASRHTRLNYNLPGHHRAARSYLKPSEFPAPP